MLDAPEATCYRLAYSECVVRVLDVKVERNKESVRLCARLRSTACARSAFHVVGRPSGDIAIGCGGAHPLRVAVAAEDARHLVATLIADGSPDAMSAAAMIQNGVERDLYAVALEPGERDAILAVLEDPPEALSQLRGVLARDQRDRM